MWKKRDSEPQPTPWRAPSGHIFIGDSVEDRSKFTADHWAEIEKIRRRTSMHRHVETIRPMKGQISRYLQRNVEKVLKKVEGARKGWNNPTE